MITILVTSSKMYCRMELCNTAAKMVIAHVAIVLFLDLVSLGEDIVTGLLLRASSYLAGNLTTSGYSTSRPCCRNGEWDQEPSSVTSGKEEMLGSLSQSTGQQKDV